MPRFFSVLLAAGCLLTGAARASADSFVIDSGAGTGNGCSFCLDGTFRMTAVGFTLGQDYDVTSVESIFHYSGTNPTSSNITISIVADTGAGQPWADQAWDGSTYPVAPLYSGTFNLPSSCCFSGWTGLTGLNWALEAGIYYAVFYADATSSQAGALNTAGLSFYSGRGNIWNFQGAPNPYNFDWGGVQGDGNFALRIGAESLEAEPVPEPSTLLLVAGGGVAAIRRLRRRRGAG